MPNTVMAADWNSLPIELQKLVIQQIYVDTIHWHRAGLRRLCKAFAEELYDGAWERSRNPFIVVKGILELCARTIRTGEKMTTHLYSMIYSTVCAHCTRKHPGNMTHELYTQLVKQIPEYIREFEGEKRMLFSRLVSHGFKYLDRFYVKRLSLATVYEMCERA